MRSTMECFQSSFSGFLAAMSLRTASTSTVAAGAAGTAVPAGADAEPGAEDCPAACVPLLLACPKIFDIRLLKRPISFILVELKCTIPRFIAMESKDPEHERN